MIQVLRAGALTTVQDGGRTGWRHLGVARGGAMDLSALHFANVLVGNHPDAAALECTFSGPELQFDTDTVIALAGPAPAAWAGGHQLPVWRPVLVRAGARVSIEPPQRGVRTTVAVSGGIDVPVVLGGRGTDLAAGMGGVDGRPLRPGDELRTLPPSDDAARVARWLLHLPVGQSRGCYNAAQWCAPRWFASHEVRPAHGSDDESDAGRIVTTLRVIAGPEWDACGEPVHAALTQQPFRVLPASNRMGVRLHGEPLPMAQGVEMVSSPVTPGTVQVPPDGQPIVLGADAQTVGGYPRIAHVISADLPLLAQAPPGSTIMLRMTGLGDAHELMRQRDAHLRELAAGVRASTL